MIKMLDRYVLKNFLINYVLSLFVLISLYVVLDLFVNIDEFTESGKPVLQMLYGIGDYYFFNLPLYFSQLSGVITLFAGCATLARLQRQNELTAILASGTSLYRIAVPIVLAGLGMTALQVLDHEFVLPRLAHKMVRVRDDVEGARVNDVWCVKDGPARLFSARQFSMKQEAIGGLIVLERSTEPATQGQMTALITADRAAWNEERGGWDLTQRGIRLELGDRTDASGALDVDHRLVPTRVTFYESSLTPKDLLLRKSAQWMQFVSLGQLDELAQRGDINPARINQIRDARFTMPISNMILLLLGISFFMNRLPESVLTQGAKALAVCSLAFLASFVGQQYLGASEGMSSALPHWLPIFVFGPIAVLLLDNVKT
jgi:lipopolysaccharide export system permease protein